MKNILFILSIIVCSEIKAQNISDAYLQAQKDHGIAHAKNQYLRLQNLFNDYATKTGKNLQKASTLYFLEENAIASNSSIVIIWTKTDTIFNKIDLISRFNNTNYSEAKPLNFHDIQNNSKEIFLSLMDFVSKTQKVNLMQEIKKKTIPPGTLLDGSNYTLYIFNKKGRYYHTNQYFFTDLTL